MAVGFIQYDSATGKKTVVSTTIPFAGLAAGVIATQNAGITLTPGDVVSKTAGNNLYKTLAPGLDETRVAIGIVISGAASGGIATIGLNGEFTIATLNFAAGQIGSVVYPSAAGGVPVTPPPTGSGSGQQKFGSVANTNVIAVNPEPQVYFLNV